MTKYIKEKDLTNELIAKIAIDIKKGKNIIFKTDTVYGIGTNAFDEIACQKIYEIKGRPPYKPLSILISEIGMLKKLVASISPAEQKLIDNFWPGPLTIKFLKKNNSLPDIISAKDEYVRIRLIDIEPATSLIKSAQIPIVAPSANLSGNPTGIKMDNIIKEFYGKVDYIIDSGNINNDSTSTIVEIKNNKAIIIREGKIKKEEIAKFVPLEDN